LRLPSEVYVSKDGSFSYTPNGGEKAWFIPAPLIYDPTCGLLYLEPKSSEKTKLISLGNEGRSTSTTLITLQTLLALHKNGKVLKEQKLYSKYWACEKTGYCNVFAIYLKTNFKDVEDMIGKIEPSCDCVLFIRVFDKDADDVKKAMPEILHISLMTLIYEMGIKDSYCDVTPSKTSLGKKIDIEKLEDGIEALKEIAGRKELAEVLNIV